MTYEEMERAGIVNTRPFGCWWCVLAAVVIIGLAALLCGCFSTYKGGKLVEGTDVAAGMSIPQSGGTLQIDAMNFCTGFRFLFDQDAGVKCVYTVTNEVSAFGVYHSVTAKSIDIKLEPTVNEAEDYTSDTQEEDVKE